MKAKLVTPNRRNSYNLRGEKETIASYNVVTLYKGELKIPITARVYAARRGAGMSKIHCSIWIHGPNHWSGGYGWISGDGYPWYHRESAALSRAILDAGWALYEDDGKSPYYIDRAGEIATKDALRALSRALGYRGKTILVNN